MVTNPKIRSKPQVRLGADIGGTFTDVVLDVGGILHSVKRLTTYSAPEQAVLDGLAILLRQSGVAADALDFIVHGTTLATNALIERRGARAAFVTTAGFRDVIEMRAEGRFEQYDLGLRLPQPLIPREHRFPVAGRIGAGGQILQELDEAGLAALGESLAARKFEAIAIGFLHSYANPDHERRARDILARHTNAPISISSEVSPQMREFERFNTVCANAYVRPLMANYLNRLKARLVEAGASCPMFLIHSGGGLISVETAAEFPVRLVESGPAGGAIFSADIAERFQLPEVVSFDMGGTTAKICLIEDYSPRNARTFEVARAYRFSKGSGMPISIPVIEMIEIGAGGGSIASVDALGRIQIGPESAGSEPGPACYGRGGDRAAITDADLLLGKIDAENFAGGEMILSAERARSALIRDVGEKLRLASEAAAFGVAEMVDENMANAARVHAVENGETISDHVMIAFGGAAPLHAARLCEKLGVERCLIPQGAGVGSAIGFLKAPFAFEAVGSRLMRLKTFDADALNAQVKDLRVSAETFVRSGAQGELTTEIVAFMRYAGQGWEIPVPLPARPFASEDAAGLKQAFQSAYSNFFGRAIDALGELEIEIVTLSVKMTETRERPEKRELATSGALVASRKSRNIFDAASETFLDSAIFERSDLKFGDRVAGPAAIVERETTTIVSAAFDAIPQSEGSLLLIRKGAAR